MTQPFAICTLAFGDAYIKQLHRLKASIRDIYPEVEVFSWINSLPEGAKPHKVSPYGFKVHAVNAARKQGYDRVLWFDTAMVMKKPVDYWFSLIPQYGIVAAKDDNKLSNHIDPLFCPMPDWHLVGGSIYAFDFTVQKSRDVFFAWETFEKDGLFSGPPMHRHDEAMMSMSLYLNGCEPVPYDVCRYNNGPESIAVKNHFK